MTIANDSTPDAGDVLAMSNIRQVYTGTGFNSSQSGGAGTDTQDHELTAVASAPDSNYAVVSITGTNFINSTDTNNVTVGLKAQIKETGGVYGDIVGFKTTIRSNGVIVGNIETSVTYRLVATLTAGQKTNGFQIKVFSQSITAGSGPGASFTNIQTVQEVRT